MNGEWISDDGVQLHANRSRKKRDHKQVKSADEKETYAISARVKKKINKQNGTKNGCARKNIIRCSYFTRFRSTL